MRKQIIAAMLLDNVSMNADQQNMNMEGERDWEDDSYGGGGGGGEEEEEEE